MQKRSFLAFIIVASLTFFGTHALAQGDNAALATLEPLQGQVQWLATGEDDWQTITEPVMIGEGDRIQTGAAGWAVLTFFEGASSEIFGNTEVLVTALELPTEENGNFIVNYDLLVGDTFNTVNTLLDAESRFEVRTPTITASVRGTEYFVMASPTGQSMVVTGEGEVETSTNITPGPIAIQGGQTLVFSTDGSPGEVLQTLVVPNIPLNAPLAEATCGDAICQPAEA
ncbi:MAG: FecR domain-containing protein, partial [Anaerolineales bacterium]